MKLLGTINNGKSEVHELEGGFLQIIPVDSIKGSSFIHKDEIQEIASLIDQNQGDIEKIRNNFLKLIKKAVADMVVKEDEHISFTFMLYNDDDVVIQSNNMASRKILEYAYRNTNREN